MSKYTNGALQVLETADKDINQTFIPKKRMNVFSAPRGEKAAGSRLKRAESFPRLVRASLLRWVLQPVIFFGT